MPLFGEEKKKYQREWIAQRRQEGIEYLGSRCIVCGSTKNLEVDHKDPKKKVNHRIWSWAWDRVLVELEKCQLLCSNCHKDKTRRNGDVRFGLGDEKYQEVVKLLNAGNLSQRKIAKQLGIAQSTVSKINTGIRKQ